MIGSKARLIYSASKQDFKEVVDLAKRDADASKIQLDVIDTDRLLKSDEDTLLDDIRLVPSQVRGQVKSGGGRTLPISGSTKLNRSIPIIIIYEGSRPVDVYPKDLMGVKYNLNSAFKTPKVIGYTWR
jgi:hypothetical protein